MPQIRGMEYMQGGLNVGFYGTDMIKHLPIWQTLTYILKCWTEIFKFFIRLILFIVIALDLWPMSVNQI